MKEFNPSIFPSRLTELRKSKKLTQLQMAERVPVSRTGYSSWEQGKSKPDLGDLFKLCVFFGVSADYLLGLSNTANQTQVNVQTAITSRDPFSDLTDEQRTVMETMLNAFRQQNAATAKQQEA